MEEHDAIELTKKLVGIESTNPGTGEKEMEDFLLSYFQQEDLKGIVVYSKEVMPKRHNVMAELAGTNGVPELIWICHMDTVPVGKDWIYDPFGTEIKDGKLYGRGACDMKSGFACALAAFTKAAKYAKEGHQPERTLKFIATVDEEGEMQGVEEVIRSGWVSEDSYVLDMEPTNGEIQVDHKGRVWLQIDVQGIIAHASTPWKGADAIAAMAKIIVDLRDEISQWREDEHLGNTTISFGRIQGGTQAYVVSDNCSVSVDIRLVPPYTIKDVTNLVEKVIGNAEMEVKGAKGSYCITGDRPSIARDDKSILLKNLRKVCQIVTGKPVKVGIFSGYTDSAVIAGKLHNRNCMSYGPGNLELAHKPNEYVTISDIMRCENVLTELAFQMLFPKEKMNDRKKM